MFLQDPNSPGQKICHTPSPKVRGCSCIHEPEVIIAVLPCNGSLISSFRSHCRAPNPGHGRHVCRAACQTQLGSVAFPALTRGLEFNPNEVPNVGIKAMQMRSLLWDWSSQIESSSSLAKPRRLKYCLCDEEKLSFHCVLLDLFRIISNPFIQIKICLH